MEGEYFKIVHPLVLWAAHESSTGPDQLGGRWT